MCTVGLCASCVTFEWKLCYIIYTIYIHTIIYKYTNYVLRKMCGDTRLLDYWRDDAPRLESWPKSSMPVWFVIRMRRASGIRNSNIPNSTVRIIHCYAYCRIYDYLTNRILAKRDHAKQRNTRKNPYSASRIFYFLRREKAYRLLRSRDHSNYLRIIGIFQYSDTRTWSCVILSILFPITRDYRCTQDPLAQSPCVFSLRSNRVQI